MKITGPFTLYSRNSISGTVAIIERNAEGPHLESETELSPTSENGATPRRFQVPASRESWFCPIAPEPGRSCKTTDWLCSWYLEEIVFGELESDLRP